MKKFPDAIHLPNDVFFARVNRNKQILKAAQFGIVARLMIIIFELVGVLITNSSALFTDALSTLSDVVSTLFFLFFVKMAQRPPDQDHPFGHGRYEPLGGLFLGILMAVLGGVMLMQQILGVVQDNFHGQIHSLSWIFPFVAVIFLEISYRYVMKIAKNQNSTGLVADAVHYRVDSVTSLVAMGALLMAAYFPEWSILIDKIGAILIALFMMVLGLYASRDNFNQLMDRTPDNTFFSMVRRAASRVGGVMGTEKIRIQSYGPDAHVDIDIEVDPAMTVDLAHKISQEVRAEIQKEWPAVRDVTVHLEPFYENDHENT